MDAQPEILSARPFKARIVFEDYPQSREEVDATAARLGIKTKIIYDP